MKKGILNIKHFPLFGILIGFILGLFFDTKIIPLLNNVDLNQMNQISQRPLGGLTFGLGMTTIAFSIFGGAVGILFFELKKNK